MSEQIDALCDNLKDRLDAIDANLQRAKANLSAAPVKAGQALQSKLDEAKARVEARSAEMKDARMRQEQTEARRGSGKKQD